MSTALALGAVSAVLRDLLRNGVIDQDVVASVGDVTVTALPPDRIDDTATDAPSQLNLFMYGVTPNLGWRNNALPARAPDGRRTSVDPLALDLHYLITAHGARDLHAEILLGYAMQLLHENPVLTRESIRTALAPPSPVPPGGGLPPTLAALGGAELADQLEQVRITQATMGIEEMSRLWAALQTPYRLSAAYLATVVLIERRRSFRSAPPVVERNLVVRAGRRPVILAVEPQVVLPGAVLTVRGRHLRAPQVRARFATASVTVPDSQVRDDVLTIATPADLRAGIGTVQVEHPVDFGTPVEPHTAFVSGLGVFLVAPRLTSATPIAATPGTPFTITVAPPVGRTQRVDVVLDQYTVPLPARPPGDPPESASLAITLPDTTPVGTFLFRVQVDGAETALVQDASGEFVGPLITVA
ncbi:DUF4255 domain-containing protein [soil metagenome]